MNKCLTKMSNIGYSMRTDKQPCGIFFVFIQAYALGRLEVMPPPPTHPNRHLAAALKRIPTLRSVPVPALRLLCCLGALRFSLGLRALST